MKSPDVQEVIEKFFSCRRCQECCKKTGFVYLAPGEEETISAFLEVDVYSFVNRFCDLAGRSRLVLKKHQDETCVFLDKEGCSIHPSKPKQCRDFPVRWRTEASYDYCQGLRKMI